MGLDGGGTLGDGAGPSRVRGCEARALEQLDEEIVALGRGCHEPLAEVGEALADEALRRVDEQDRRLEAALAIDQLGLLRRVLEVVAGVGLVGDGAGEARCARGEVRVDIDPGAPTAIEPVVGGPRLVADEPDTQVLAVGEPEPLGRHAPEALDEPVEDGRQAIDRDLEPGIPRGQSVFERAVAREEPVDLRRGVVEPRVRDPRRPVVEAAGHVVEIGQLVAGKGRRLGLERDQLDVEPATTVGLGHLGRQPGAESGGIVAETTGRSAAARCRPGPSARQARSSRRRVPG